MITIPGQNILMDTLTGIDPVWYGKLQAIFGVASGFDTNSSGGFSAHKNNIDQTIGSITITKVTFTTELFDVGGTYDAPNSRWTPPAGIVQISAALYCDGGQGNLYVYKNGAVLRATFVIATGQIGPTISLVDQANGTDYYEIWVLVGTAPFKVLGNTSFTWWTGIRRPA